MHILCSGDSANNLSILKWWPPSTRHHFWKKNNNKPTKTSSTFFIQLSHHITHTRFSQPAKLFIKVKVCGCRAPNFSSQPSKARRKIRSASAVLPCALEGADFGVANSDGRKKNNVFCNKCKETNYVYIHEKNTYILRKYTEYTCTFWVPNGS